MNQNLIIGVLVVIILLLGGYMLMSSSFSGVATSTPMGVVTPSPGPTPTPTPSRSADAPRVETNSGATVLNSTAVVTGLVAPNGAPTTYWYEYGPSTALGQRTSEQTIGSGFVPIASPGYITGLSANTTYYFRLSAQNRIGIVHGATESFTTNTNPPPPGSPPSVSTQGATGIERTSADLNARVDPNDSPTTYWFEWGDNAAFGSVTAFSSVGSGSVSVPISVSISRLNPLTKYYFRINAQNQYGTVNGATQSFTTKGPPAPKAPTVDTTSATKIATSSAILQGRISPNGAETVYWFEYGTTPLLTTILGTVTSEQKISSNASTLSVSAELNGLAKNTRYYCRVVARNDFGTVRGDVVDFKTRP